MDEQIKPVGWLCDSEFFEDLQLAQVHRHFRARKGFAGQLSELYDQQAIDTLRAEVERLRAKTACTMGVGDGSGQLFVHGDYESIKAAQALVLRAERAEAEAQLGQWVMENFKPTFHRATCDYVVAEGEIETPSSFFTEDNQQLAWQSLYDAAKQGAE